MTHRKDAPPSFYFWRDNVHTHATALPGPLCECGISAVLLFPPAASGDAGDVGDFKYAVMPYAPDDGAGEHTLGSVGGSAFVRRGGLAIAATALVGGQQDRHPPAGSSGGGSLA